MSTADDQEQGQAPPNGASRARQVRRSNKAATSDALRAAFSNSAEGPVPDQPSAAKTRTSSAPGAQLQRQRQSVRRKAPTTTAFADPAEDGAADEDRTEVTAGVGNSVSEDAAGTERSDRLVSEAVMAGLDAMSVSAVRVPVGAGGGGGGGLPPTPEDRADDKPATQPAKFEPTPVIVPDEDPDLESAIARRREPKDHPLVAVGHLLDGFLRECGDLTLLTGQVFKSAILHPKGYWGDVRDQLYDAIKLCWLPMVIAVGVFGFAAPGLQGGNILYLFGVPDRLGGFMMFATIREFGPFVEAMVVAGVVGTAITADLGARRIREEIDAMEVLGVDPVRKLMVPRIISLIIMTAFFDMLALLVGLVGGYLAGVYFLTSSPSGFVASFYTETNLADDWGSFLKCAIFGLCIGVVCCYKGFRAKGGPAGVGRAVNQAVVISFALIWVTDYTFTNLLLGYAPSTQVIK